jgi:hypothetical protein
VQQPQWSSLRYAGLVLRAVGDIEAVVEGGVSLGLAHRQAGRDQFELEIGFGNG